MTTQPPLVARILLIDDHPAVRQGLRILLATRNHHISAEVESCIGALAVLENEEADVALLDLTLQDGSGLELLPELEARGVSVVIYSMHEDPDTINRAFRLGALGYVTKREEPEALFEAIDTVMRGKRYMSPCATQSREETQGEGQQIEDAFSDREREIFILMGKGASNAELAETFDISPRTVETYFSRMVKKLEFKNLRELRKFAISSALKGA
ncbi:response regulator transcription factor [Halodesulfovibrio aestuarii]|uniref:Response regulator n=1 Tax=Halodesulfovibrio aestuarii TaxID=126333 RepID=A0ABV4JV01_9BACT